MTPYDLTHELERLYGDDLRAVVLYGADTGSTAKKKTRFSDSNIFCVLSDPSPAMLARANPVLKKWARKGNRLPHFFGPTHIETSLDIFPLDFLEIQDRHEVLLGQDPLAAIEVDAQNLRHQCESELKGKLIHLRAFYAGNYHKPKRVAELMAQSFSDFIAAFRGILRLLQETPPKDDRAVIDRLSQQLDFNPEIFFDVLALRDGETPLPRGDDALSAFERYITEIEAITTYVDQLTVR